MIDLPPILIDTREPDPHPWEIHFTVPAIRGTLSTGDFSLPGCDHLVCVERKTVDDLIACLCGNRERFSKELARAAAIPHFWVVCEGSYGQLLSGQYRSQMTPQSAFQSVVALMTRYRIPFLMASDTPTAAVLTESLLAKWWREHILTIETAQKAARQIQRGATARPSI